jgi:hypothetical protein
MLLATSHAIYSAAVSTEETATFMLLPSWNKKMSTNPYASLCRKYPHMCKIPRHHPIKPTPICESALLDKHTNTTFQTLLGIEDHCHTEHRLAPLLGDLIKGGGLGARS